METISGLPTPSFLIDLDRVERNCRRMREKADASGVALRPHVKTHKTIEGAKLQLGKASGPITVSTLAEAEFFADHGFTDITYAVPIVADKLDRAAALQRRIEVLHLLVDHPDAFSSLESYAEAHAISFSAFLKVDCGYHRAGVDPASDSGLDLAIRMARSVRVTLAGLLTHAGHSYHASDPGQIAEIAREEADAVDLLSRRVADAGFPRPIRSVGSTPTASVVERFDGTDELRPGNYLFYDAFQASIGSCDWNDCAATVLASILSIHQERREILVDAGALALSKDLGADHLPDRPISYGAVYEEGRVADDMRLTALSQEHGKIEVATAERIERMRIGQKIRIIMNHSCLTAAMFDRYHVVRGDEIVDEWRPVRGW